LHLSGTRSPLDSDVTGARLGRVALVYLTMAVAVITLGPFRFAPAPINGLRLIVRAFDVAMNIAMFVPIGFIHGLSRPRGSSRDLLGAAGLGLGISALIESAQFFAPGRYPSPVDLATNASGAGLGAWLADRALRPVSGPSALRASAVDLPLMALVYLLAPLLWLVGMSSARDGRVWILLPLTGAAGWTISSVLTSFDRASRSRLMVATAAWLLVALTPSAVRSVSIAAALAGAGLLAAWIRAGAPPRLTHEKEGGRSTRRFEARTLHVVLPLFVLYLVLASFTPLAPRNGAWLAMFTLVPPARSLDNGALLGAVEHIAAFTLMGYAIAEYNGRSRDRFHQAIPPVLLWATVAAVPLQALRGWHPAYGASLSLFVLTLFGAVLGGWIYVLQLVHIRALTSKAPDPR
jgi:VanZ family protein